MDRALALDVKPLIASLAEEAPRVSKWKLIINEPVGADF
jgi:hypothetical protein